MFCIDISIIIINYQYKWCGPDLNGGKLRDSIKAGVLYNRKSNHSSFLFPVLETKKQVGIFTRYRISQTRFRSLPIAKK